MIDRLNKKQERLKKIEEKIRALNREKSKITKEIELIKMQQDLEKYKAVEVMLEERGMNLEEIINKAIEVMKN